MQQHVWGKPGLKWDGFKPTGYWLDAEKVRSLSLKELPSARNTTIGEVVEKFRGEEVEVDCAIVSVKLKSASQELTVEGPGFHLNLLKLLYRFAEGKVSPYEAVWFYFDGDSCRTDPQSAYSFFIVAQDKIVEENLTLSDSIGNGFDPSVLVHDDSAPIWFAERAWDEATDRYWHRKFYSQTRSGPDALATRQSTNLSLAREQAPTGGHAGFSAFNPPRSLDSSCPAAAVCSAALAVMSA